MGTKQIKSILTKLLIVFGVILCFLNASAQSIENEMMSHIGVLPENAAYADSAFWVWGSSVMNKTDVIICLLPAGRNI